MVTEIDSTGLVPITSDSELHSPSSRGRPVVLSSLRPFLRHAAARERKQGYEGVGARDEKKMTSIHVEHRQDND